MEEIKFPITARELGERLNVPVVGDGETEIHCLAPIKSAGQGSLSFFASQKFGKHLTKVRDAVLFTKKELVRSELPVTYLVVPDPQMAFASVAVHFKPQSHWAGVSDKASIHPEAILDEDVCVGPFAVINSGAHVKKGAKIGAFAFIGEGVEIGEFCEIYPRVTLLNGVKLGNRVIIFPGTVVGSDGFGFVQDPATSRHKEIPQVGTVVIEDDVRIGANCTLDRAALGETRIGSGTKFDDQVHIGHNSVLGKNCIMCAQSGLAGSVELEDEVMLGGQSGVNPGVKVGKGARLAGQSGLLKNTKGGETYFLMPGMPIERALKVIRTIRRLPEIVEELRKNQKGSSQKP